MARSCGWIAIVRCWLQHNSGMRSWLLVKAGGTGWRLLLCGAQHFAELGLHLPLQAYCPKSGKHECKIRYLHHCLFPRDENKDIDGDRNFPTVAKAAQPPPVGRLLFTGFHQAILGVFCGCVCLADQGSGHRKTRGLAVLLPIWLMGDRLEGVSASQMGIPLLEDLDLPKLWSLQDRE